MKINIPILIHTLDENEMAQTCSCIYIFLNTLYVSNIGYLLSFQRWFKVLEKDEINRKDTQVWNKKIVNIIFLFSIHILLFSFSFFKMKQDIYLTSKTILLKVINNTIIIFLLKSANFWKKARTIIITKKCHLKKNIAAFKKNLLLSS